jgi:hypothetical protein
MLLFSSLAEGEAVEDAIAICCNVPTRIQTGVGGRTGKLAC